MATKFHTLKVKDIKRETDECVSITFEIPEEYKDLYGYKSGQYLTLRRDLEGNEVRRSYSICSFPGEDDLSVAVKKVESGKFSSYANSALKPGDEIEVLPPMGNFISKKETSAQSFLFIAAGSGITPVISIIQDLLSKNKDAEITLIYGNRNRANIIFKEKIEAVKNRYMHRFNVIHIFSREVADTQLFNGRINAEKLEQLGKHLVNYSRMDEVFICGPEEMILGARSFFVDDLKMETNSVHFELFSSPDQPKHVSEEWKKKVASIDQSQSSQVTIRLDGVAFDMEVKYVGENILDAALKNGADLPYACKGGVCATCKAKLIEGEVEMELNYSLEPDELANNYILTCQSHPRSEKVVVDFDYK